MPRGCTRPSIGKPRARWRALTRALRQNLLRAMDTPYSRAFNEMRATRTSKLILDSVRRSTTRQKHSRDATRATHGTCMVPRPLSRPHHLLGRLPSNGELARTRTSASERSRSRLTRHGARDDTRHKSCDISRQRARTHALALAPSCTRLCSGSAPTPRSRSPPAPTTYARLQPHLPTAELQAPRAAQRGWSLLERMDRRMVSRASRLPMASR